MQQSLAPRSLLAALLMTLAMTALNRSASAQVDSDVEFVATELQPGLHVLMAKGGGNVAVSIITFDQGLALHWNGDTLEVVHPDPAHTDGDAIVHFVERNVVHTGDLFFNGVYPFIDASSGGSISGMVKGLDAVLARIDDDTVIIPGHGLISNKAEMTVYRTMLDTVSSRFAALKAEGKSVEEVVAARPTAAFDEDFNDGFLKADVWIRMVFGAP